MQRPKSPEITRRTANFHPSVWGDRFISYASNSLVEKSKDDTNNEKTGEMLKESVKNMILSPTESTSAKLDFIDVVERLGVSYHFGDEIEMVLRKIYENSTFDCSNKEEENQDLYTVALKFRLLRQQGYNVSCDVFNKFKNSEGKFKKLLVSDVRGMLSLYEPIWWKELDFVTKLPFARDRVIECYFWILGVYFEPQYSFARTKMTKVIAVTSVIDDIYDVYGTLEELELFTQAAERWDISVIDQLPDYMKLCYKALLDVYTEIGEELRLEDGKLYRLDYAIEAMKILIRAYFKEAKWFHTKYVPTMEEYMTVALVTSGYSMLTTTSFVGMDDIVTKNSFEWLFSNPKLLRASEIIGRLMDDIVSHKFEQKRGHAASAIECYINQYGGTEEEAVNKLREKVNNAWKDINEEWLNPNSVPMPLRMRILNLTHVIDLLYTDEDYYTNPGEMLKEIITSILIDSINF